MKFDFNVTLPVRAADPKEQYIQHVVSILIKAKIHYYLGLEPFIEDVVYDFLEERLKKTDPNNTVLTGVGLIDDEIAKEYLVWYNDEASKIKIPKSKKIKKTR